MIDDTILYKCPVCGVKGSYSKVLAHSIDCNYSPDRPLDMDLVRPIPTTEKLWGPQ